MKSKTNQFFFLFVLFSLISLPSFAQKFEIGYTEDGEASYYSDKLHRKPTASGEMHNKYDLVAAHRTLPFGTKVKVTCVKTGKSVVVKINDRGPYKAGRIIDLSKRAFEEIESLNAGVTKVQIEVVELPENAKDLAKNAGKTDSKNTTANETAKNTEDKEKSNTASTKENTTSSKTSTNTGTSSKTTTSASKTSTSSKTTSGKTSTTTASKTTTPAKSSSTPSGKTSTSSTLYEKQDPNLPDFIKFKPTGTYSIWGTLRKDLTGFCVQMGSYRDLANAIELANQLHDKKLGDVFVLAEFAADKPIYRIVMYAVKEEEEAQRLAKQLELKGYRGVFVRKHQ